VAFFVSYVFCYCEKNHLTIKMPDSVPSGVARAFEALIPGVILFTAASVVFGLCHYLGATTLPELLFKVIQTPLQSLSDTIGGGIVIVGLQSILFWAGVHGPNVVGGVVSPLLLANSLDNQAILDAGGQLLNNPAAHIITAQINDVFVKSGGCGLTLGLIIASLIVARSKQMSSLMRMATVPGLFNINEPIIFGLPIVFNPYLLVPFIIVPVVALLITYFAIAIGFMAPLSAVQVPWTTPPVIAGFLLSGWQGAVVQIINLAVATIIYLPFVKAQDKSLLAEEQEEAAAETDSTAV
jgi:PTS system cellobiose-specific IIC component